MIRKIMAWVQLGCEIMGRKKSRNPAIVDLESDEMCLVCGVRPRGSVMKHNRPGTLYCGFDCAKAAQRNFKRRTSGDIIGKLVLTLKSLTEDYGNTPVSANQWLNGFRERYKTTLRFERTLMLTNMVRGIINPETIEIEKDREGWRFRYLEGDTISEWLAPNARAKFDAIRNEVGGTATVVSTDSEVAESLEAESDSDLIYQDSLGEPWVYYPSDMLTQFHRPYLTKMVIPITENNDSFLSNGQKVSISPENNKWYYSDLKSRIEDPLLFKDTPYFGDLDPETEEMNIRRNPITGQDYYTFELEGVIQGVTYDETENVSKALDDWNWSKEGEARQVMEYALGDFLGGYSEKWEPAGGVSVGLLTEGPEGALRHMGHWYPTMVVKKAILRNSLGEVVESYEVDSTNGAVQESIHPEYLHLFDEDYRQYGAEGEPSRDNDRVAVGDRVRSYDFVLPNGELIRDDSYIEGTVTKIGEWEYCPCGTDHVFILVEEVVRQGEKVSATGMDMAFPVITESFITVLDTDVRDSEMLYAQEYYVHSPDEFYGPYYSLEEAEEAVERLMRRGIEIRGITEGQDNWMSEMREEYGCDRCGEEVPDGNAYYPKVAGDDDDTRICEDCYFEDSQFSIYEAEDWNWGGDPDGPLAKALRKVKNNPKKIKPLELVRLPKSDEEVKEAETWNGPFGIETRTATGAFKKWEKVETYDKLVDKLTEMFREEGFSPYALDVYAERMPRVEMTAAGPVVVNDRKMLLATYKYGKWESGPWMAYLPKR